MSPGETTTLTDPSRYVFHQKHTFVMGNVKGMMPEYVGKKKRVIYLVAYEVIFF